MLAKLNLITAFVESVSFYHFLDGFHLGKADGYASGPRTLCKYLLEIALLDESFLKYTVSLKSAACYYLSMKVLQFGEWVCLKTKLSFLIDLET
jgi:hypothetical protein